MQILLNLGEIVNVEQHRRSPFKNYTGLAVIRSGGKAIFFWMES
jgi:hypothetical protein